MWVHEHVAETAVGPAAVWRVLSDLDRWDTWDTSMEWVRLQGPFGVGSQVLMKPKGQDPITSVIVEAVENEVYADETDMGDVRLLFSHTLEPLSSGGTRVVHRLEISGPGALSNVRPTITPSHPVSATIRKASRASQMSPLPSTGMFTCSTRAAIVDQSA